MYELLPLQSQVSTGSGDGACGGDGDGSADEEEGKGDERVGDEEGAAMPDGRQDSKSEDDNEVRKTVLSMLQSVSYIHLRGKMAALFSRVWHSSNIPAIALMPINHASTDVGRPYKISSQRATIKDCTIPFTTTLVSQIDNSLFVAQ